MDELDESAVPMWAVVVLGIIAGSFVGFLIYAAALAWL